MQGIAKAVQCCSLSAVPYHLDLSIIICQQLSQRISNHSFTHLVGFFYKNCHCHCQCHSEKIIKTVDEIFYLQFSRLWKDFYFYLQLLMPLSLSSYVCMSLYSSFCWSCQVSPSLWTISQKGHMSLGILFATCYQ